VDATHWPFWQTLPLPQAVPFAAGAAGLHLPFWQLSLPLQALPSEQLLLLFVCTQPCCAVQVSFVQGLLSLQFSCWQLKTQLPPPWQTCPEGQFRGALSCPLSQVWN
jgi:hypothetical protein